MSDTKLIQFKVPREFYEDFWRAFPERGERTRILVKLMGLAIRMHGDKDAFIDMLREEARLEAEE